MKIIPDMDKIYETTRSIYREALKQRKENPEADFEVTWARVHEAAVYTTKLFEFAKEHKDEFDDRFFKD